MSSTTDKATSKQGQGGFDEPSTGSASSATITMDNSGSSTRSGLQIIKEQQRALLLSDRVNDLEMGTDDITATTTATASAAASASAKVGTGTGTGTGNSTPHLEIKGKQRARLAAIPDEEYKEEEQKQAAQDPFFPLPLPQALPSTNGSSTLEAVAAPGAYADGGPGRDVQLRASLPMRIISGFMNLSLHSAAGGSTTGTNTTVHQDSTAHPDTQGLVQANLISEEEETKSKLSLPHAEEHSQDGDDDCGASARRSSRTRSLVVLVVVALVVAIAAAVVVTFVLTKSSSSSSSSTASSTANSTTTTAAPTTTAPTAIANNITWLLDLPEVTQAIILADPESYQARAHRWLQNDPFIDHHTYTQARIEQRFALACICYATNCNVDAGVNADTEAANGNTATIATASNESRDDQRDTSTGWTRSEGWLSYNTDECDWLSRGGMGFASFPDRSALVQALIDFTNFFLAGNRTAFAEWEDTLNNFDASRTCNDKGLYTNLYLYRNNLVGTIPPELYAYLPNLVSLDLTFNSNLGGAISSDIQRLTNLEFLWLGSDAMTGVLPAELGALSKLQVFHVVGTAITGAIPSEVGHLSNLVFISLMNNELSFTIPSELSQLSYLVNLELSKNYLTGPIPTELGLLTDLRTLRTFSNALSGPIVSELGQLSLLRMLDVNENMLASSIPSEVGRLDKISYLHLGDNMLTGSLPNELGLMEALESFHVNSNLLTGSLPSELYGLGTLSTLMVHNNPLMTGSIGLPELFTGMTSLTALSMTNTDLSGEFPMVLCNASRLELLFNCSAILCGCDCSCS